MAEDELDLELEDNSSEEIISRKDKRIKSLSEKFTLSEKEKTDLAKAREEEVQARQAVEKERDFFKGFSQVSAKYQGANEYQDKIWEKVKSGYDVEDAAVAVLNKEGKFTPAAPVIERQSAAGGSASTGINDNVEKTAKDMTQSERKSILLDMESRGDFKL